MASIAKSPCELTLQSLIECVGRSKITMQIHTTHLEGISEKFKLRANLNNIYYCTGQEKTPYPLM